MKPAIAKKQQIVSSATEHLAQYTEGISTIALAQFSHMSALRMDQLREVLRPHNTGVRVIKRRLASRILRTRSDWAPLDPFTTERIMLVSSSDIHGLVGMKEAIDKLGLHDRIFVVAAVIAGDLVSPEQIQSLVSCGSVGGAYASLLSMGVSVITGFLRLVETLLEKGTEMSSMNLSEKIKSASTQDKKVREFLELFSELSIKQLLEAKECFEEAKDAKDLDMIKKSLAEVATFK